MDTPNYTITPKLLLTIGSIERIYGQLEALRIPKKLELNLCTRNMIQSSYASNRIEGNPLTLPEVTNLLLGDRVPTNRNEKEVVNYFKIIDRLDKYVDKPFSLDLVLDFHEQLFKGIDKTAGTIRNVKVIVGKYKEEKGDVSLRVKHDPPHHDRKSLTGDITDLMAWTKKTNDLPISILAGLFHHQFVYIHPFEDGNGRVCRLLSALLFVKAGYFINKYFILDDWYDIDRQQYSDFLHDADSGKKTRWLEYFSDGVMYSLKGALARTKDAIRTLAIAEQPSPKEKEVMALFLEKEELLSSDIARALNVSRQQAHNLLKNLVSKKLLDKKGKTKSSYYQLA